MKIIDHYDGFIILGLDIPNRNDHISRCKVITFKNGLKYIPAVRVPKDINLKPVIIAYNKENYFYYNLDTV